MVMITTELKLAVIAPNSSRSSQSTIPQYFVFKWQGHSSGQYAFGSCSISGIGHFVSRRQDSSPDRWIFVIFLKLDWSLQSEGPKVNGLKTKSGRSSSSKKVFVHFQHDSSISSYLYLHIGSMELQQLH